VPWQKKKIDICNVGVHREFNTVHFPLTGEDAVLWPKETVNSQNIFTWKSEKGIKSICEPIMEKKIIILVNIADERHIFHPREHFYEWVHKFK
jgi:hypothetical protein